MLKVPQQCDVVIVGAGLAGLSAACELKKLAPELKVIIIEGKNRIGGRTVTEELKTANGTDKWDLGGQWIASTQRHSLQLAKACNLELYPQPSVGLNLARLGGLQVKEYDHSGLNLKTPTAFDIEQFDEVIATLDDMLNPLDVFAHPMAMEWDEISVLGWIRQHFKTRFAVDCIDYAVRALYGADGKRLSLLYFLWDGRTAGSIRDVYSSSESGAQGFLVKVKNYPRSEKLNIIKGGTQQMSQWLAKSIGFHSIKCNTAVAEIERDGDNGTVTVHLRSMGSTDKGTPGRIQCSRVILAIPPAECGRILFFPPMPYTKRQIFDCTPSGNLFKCVFTYRRPFWRDRGFSGYYRAVGYTDRPGQIAPVCEAFDGTTKDGNAALIAFVNPEWSEVSPNERWHAVIEDLAQYFGPECRDYIDATEKLWSLESFIGGCPKAFVPVGNMNAFMRIREPVDQIHFAGTDTGTSWPGSMNGAIESGYRSSHEILCHLKPAVVNQDNLYGSVYAKDYRPPSMPYGTHYPATGMAKL